MDTKLTDPEKRELQRAYKDAAAKAAALPDRIKAEDELADLEHREPFPIQPLTEIRACLVVKAIEAIQGTPAPEVCDIIGVYRRSCGKAGNAKVLLLSEQLKLLLDTAGIGGDAKPDAQVQR